MYSKTSCVAERVVGVFAASSKACSSRSVHSVSKTLRFSSFKDPVSSTSRQFSPNQTPLENKRLFHSTSSLFGGSSNDNQTSGIVQFKLADIGEGIAECEILKWHVKEGDKIHQFDLLCEVQSDKANVEITSRYEGVIKKLHWKKGEMAKVGSPLVEIDLGNSSAPAAEASKSASSTPSTSSTSTSSSHSAASKSSHNNQGDILATPAVRHIARKNNINLTNVNGSGRDGRVLKEDILNFISQGGSSSKPTHKPSETPQFSSTPSKPVSAPEPSISQPSVSVSSGDRVVPLSGYSRIMVKTMNAANQIPHFGYSDEIIVDKLISFRSELKSVSDKKGVKMTYMPIIIKAASLALKSYPILNSSYDANQNALIYKSAHNIGIAVDSPNGLIVPNIKNVQDKTILEVAAELNRIVKAASEGQLGQKDLSGGTFTLSNIGSIGGTYASPVLVVPEVAIGALGRFQKVPRYDEKGNVVPTTVMNISWAADHRVIDGATMANFSNLWKRYLEFPSTIILDAK